MSCVRVLERHFYTTKRSQKRKNEQDNLQLMLCSFTCLRLRGDFTSATGVWQTKLHYLADQLESTKDFKRGSLPWLIAKADS